jgi:hypothetical protein
MSRTYFRLWYRLDGADGYLIWFSNEEDGVVVAPNGTAPAFRDLAALQAYADSQHLDLLIEEPILHDLDNVAAWLARPVHAIDCDVFLTAWNLFADLAASTGAGFAPDDERTRQIYEKLFWDNNLPSMTPPGERYVPRWSAAERRTLRAVLGSGLALFRGRVRWERGN